MQLFDSSVDQTRIFGFPMGIYQIDARDSGLTELAREIEDEERRSKGVALSNRGGWQSEKAFFEDETTAFARVKQHIFGSFETFLSGVYGRPISRDTFDIEAWANVNYRGHYNASHDHTLRDNHWSGILYLQTGYGEGEVSTGITVFENQILTGDGRYIATVPVLRDAPDAAPAELAIVPRVGRLVFFPGTLRHRVTTYEGEAKRITVAFNIRVSELANHTYHTGSLRARAVSYMSINFRGLVVAAARVRQLLK